MARIEPTVGRVVWYYLYEHQRAGRTEPFAAMIASTSAMKRDVNIGYLDHAGNHCSMQDIPLVQDGEQIPDDSPRGYCTWMPYQIGQAKKTEELQREALNFSRPPKASFDRTDPL